MDENIVLDEHTKDVISKKKKIIKEVKSILMIIVVVFTFRSVFFEPFRIPSGSMIPSLMIGDFILVNKFAYGFKVPFSDFTLGNMSLNPIYLFGKSNPKRGDVVVFKYPNEKSINYIKRVIGLPGDTIEMYQKKIFINGREIETSLVSEAKAKELRDDMDEGFRDKNFDFLNAKTGDHKHIIQIDKDNYLRTNFEKRTIPKGMFFVMGDNRDYSSDSRFWGLVRHEEIKGRAILVWFSFISPLDDKAVKFRPYRIGTMIN